MSFLVVLALVTAITRTFISLSLKIYYVVSYCFLSPSHGLRSLCIWIAWIWSLLIFYVQIMRKGWLMSVFWRVSYILTEILQLFLQGLFDVLRLGLNIMLVQAGITDIINWIINIFFWNLNQVFSVWLFRRHHLFLWDLIILTLYRTLIKIFWFEWTISTEGISRLEDTPKFVELSQTFDVLWWLLELILSLVSFDFQST